MQDYNWRIIFLRRNIITFQNLPNDYENKGPSINIAISMLETSPALVEFWSPPPSSLHTPKRQQWSMHNQLQQEHRQMHTLPKDLCICKQTAECLKKERMRISIVFTLIITTYQMLSPNLHPKSAEPH